MAARPLAATSRGQARILPEKKGTGHKQLTCHHLLTGNLHASLRRHLARLS